MKHWDNLIFSSDIFQTGKGNAIIFNITDNKMSDCEVNVNDTIMYMNEKYEVINIERFVKTFNDFDGNPLPGDNFAFLVKKEIAEIKEFAENIVKQLEEKYGKLTLADDDDPMVKLLQSEPIQKIEGMPNE